MTLNGEDYAIAAFCEFLENDVPLDVGRCAAVNCKDGKSLEANIQAAIKAAEWLREITR